MESDYYKTTINIESNNKEIDNYLNQLTIVEHPYFGIREIGGDGIRYETKTFPKEEIEKILSELVKIDEDVSISVESWNMGLWEVYAGIGKKEGFEYTFIDEVEFESERDFINNFQSSLIEILKEVKENYGTDYY